MGYALDVARTAHKPTIKWVASFVRFVGQLHATILANVTIYVEIFVHGNNAYGFLCALQTNSNYPWLFPFTLELPHRKNKTAYLDRSDSFSTGSTLRSEHSVIIVDTVNLIVNVNSEGNTVETLVADATSKAPWMIGLPHGL